MTSKFDYPDPGQDADYCDSLSAILSAYHDAVEAALSAVDELPDNRCLNCGEPCPNEDFYCSAFCAILAQSDRD